MQVCEFRFSILELDWLERGDNLENSPIVKLTANNCTMAKVKTFEAIYFRVEIDALESTEKQNEVEWIFDSVESPVKSKLVCDEKGKIGTSEIMYAFVASGIYFPAIRINGCFVHGISVQVVVEGEACKDGNIRKNT